MNRCVEITLHKKRCKRKTTHVYCHIHQPECSICLTDINNLVTLHCGHNFCKSCIYEWACVSKCSCPLCRRDISEDEKVYAFDWGIENNILAYGIEYTFYLSIFSPEEQEYFMNETGIVKYTPFNYSDMNRFFINIFNEQLRELWTSISETVTSTTILLENESRKEIEVLGIFIFI